MDIPAGHDLNADQIAYWNGPGGQHWTERQQVQDALLAPVSDILIDRATPRAGERIVDVGCGCGATSTALAHKVGPTGHVLGIDISVPMLARARQLAPAGMPVDFVLADATVYPFEPASFDLLVSRFGVMFFAIMGQRTGRLTSVDLSIVFLPGLAITAGPLGNQFRP